MGARNDGGRESVVLAGLSELLLTGIKFYEVVEATDRFQVVSQAHAIGWAPTLALWLNPDYTPKVASQPPFIYYCWSRRT